MSGWWTRFWGALRGPTPTPTTDPRPVAQPTPPPTRRVGPLVVAAPGGLVWLDAGEAWVLLVFPGSAPDTAPDERPVVAMIVFNTTPHGDLAGTLFKHRFSVPADAVYALDPSAPIDRPAAAEPATVFLPPARLTVGALTLESGRGQALSASWRGRPARWVLGLGLSNGALLGPPLATGVVGWAQPPDDRRDAGEILPLLEALQRFVWRDGGDPAAAGAAQAWAALGVVLGDAPTSESR